MKYTIKFTPAADKDVDALASKVRLAIGKRIDSLGGNPRPRDAVALQGTLRGSYRIRVRKYRIAYQVDDTSRVVTVWQIGHRSKFYEKAKQRRR